MLRPVRPGGEQVPVAVAHRHVGDELAVGRPHRIEGAARRFWMPFKRLWMLVTAQCNQEIFPEQEKYWMNFTEPMVRGRLVKWH